MLLGIGGLRAWTWFLKLSGILWSIIFWPHSSWKDAFQAYFTVRRRWPSDLNTLCDTINFANDKLVTIIHLCSRHRISTVCASKCRGSRLKRRGNSPLSNNSLIQGSLIHTSCKIVICQGEGFLFRETHANVIEGRCSIPSRKIINILPSVWFSINILNMSGKIFSLAKHIKAASVTSPNMYVVHDRWDEPDPKGMPPADNMPHTDTANANQITWHYKWKCKNSDSLVYLSPKMSAYLPAKTHPKGIRNEQTYTASWATWNGKVIGPASYNIRTIPLHIRPRVYLWFENFNIIWDGHLSQINRRKHRIELDSPDRRLIYSAQYQSGPLRTRTQELRNRQNDGHGCYQTGSYRPCVTISIPSQHFVEKLEYEIRLQLREPLLQVSVNY